MRITELNPETGNKTDAIGGIQVWHLGVLKAENMKKFATILTALMLSMLLASCVSPPRTSADLRELREEVTERPIFHLLRIGVAFEAGEVVPRSPRTALAWYYVTDLEYRRHTCTRERTMHGGHVYDCKPTRWQEITHNFIYDVKRYVTDGDDNYAKLSARKCIKSRFEDCPGDYYIFSNTRK